MYSCNIIEFASSSHVGIACETSLVFTDQYCIYDNALTPRLELPQNSGDTWVSSNGIWINTDAPTQYSKITSKRISINTWTFDDVRSHKCTDWNAEIEGTVFVVEDCADAEVIIAYNKESKQINKIEFERLRGCLVAHKNCLYASERDGSIYCLDSNLIVLWKDKKNKSIYSSNSNLRFPIPFDGLVINNVGEDKTGARGNFEINAYKFDTGELVWQQIVETSPESNNLVGDKFYLSVNDRFIKIDAKTGKIELDVVFGYKTFDEQKGSVSVVYPVEQGLLCFNHQNHFIELRSHDATTILQTVKLPETYAYHLSVKPPVIEHEGKIYFALGHLVMGLNPMKSAIAVLTPDATAPANCEAQLEQRPPYTVESFKDEKGKNALRVRMGGNDAHKIMRYAHVVLKELAFRTGLTSFFEFETRDIKNAGILELEIDTSELPTEKNKEQWLEHFGVLKTRVESELKTNDILAGDGKSNYQVTVSVV